MRVNAHQVPACAGRRAKAAKKLQPSGGVAWPLHPHRAASARHGGGRDGAAMALRNGAAQRQPCAHAFKLAFAVQALEHTKQCAGACGVKPHAVVLHGKGHMASRCDNSLHGKEQEIMQV